MSTDSATLIIAALVAGVATSVVVFVVQRILARLIPWRVEQASRDRRRALDIIRQYTDPIASSSIDLLRRLDEVASSRARSDFLSRPHLSAYSSYKLETTLYRMGSLLGWIYSFRRERFFFPRIRSLWPTRINRQAKTVEMAIDAFRSALADGSDVEALRARKLACLWCINLDVMKVDELAVELELCIDKYLYENGRIKSVLELSSEKKVDLCTQIYCVLRPCSDPEDSAVKRLRETTQEAIDILGIREHWVFRDWQDMIGSHMVTKTDVGTRMFDVISLVEFKKFFAQEPKPQWVALLLGLFEGVDLHEDNPMNVRRTQLLNMRRAIAQMILALRALDKHVVPAGLDLRRLRELADAEPSLPNRSD